MRWDFFVRHYDDDGAAAARSELSRDVNGKRVDGVLYPRAGTLGGCTAHNAMILVCPHDSDWNQLADLTGDPSWRAERMRAYFERLEHCDYRARGSRARQARHQPEPPRLVDGWLHTERAVPGPPSGDRDLRQVDPRVGARGTRRCGPAVGAAVVEQRGRSRTTGASPPTRASGLRFTPMTTATACGWAPASGCSTSATRTRIG